MEGCFNFCYSILTTEVCLFKILFLIQVLLTAHLIGLLSFYKCGISNSIYQIKYLYLLMSTNNTEKQYKSYLSPMMDQTLLHCQKEYLKNVIFKDLYSSFL